MNLASDISLGINKSDKVPIKEIEKANKIRLKNIEYLIESQKKEKLLL